MVVTAIENTDLVSLSAFLKHLAVLHKGCITASLCGLLGCLRQLNINHPFVTFGYPAADELPIVKPYVVHSTLR